TFPKRPLTPSVGLGALDLIQWANTSSKLLRDESGSSGRPKTAGDSGATFAGLKLPKRLLTKSVGLGATGMPPRLGCVALALQPPIPPPSGFRSRGSRNGTGDVVLAPALPFSLCKLLWNGVNSSCGPIAGVIPIGKLGLGEPPPGGALDPGYSYSKTLYR